VPPLVASRSRMFRGSGDGNRLIDGAAHRGRHG
jgi:hypothetical protein